MIIKHEGTEKVFFTSDHHFGHANIIKHCARPFVNVQEMDTCLVNRWNKAVRKDDIVYHMGGVTLYGSPQFEDYIFQLNGHIRIIPGNHDTRWLKKYKNSHQLLQTKPVGSITILPPLVTLKVNIYTQHPLKIILCHYALRTWESSHHGSYHLYGHSHGHLKNWRNSLDVGVDCHDYYPITFAQALRKIEA